METSQPAAYPDLQHLTQMIQRVDDRQQLAELISRYGMVVDDRDFLRLEIEQCQLPLADLEDIEVGVVATLTGERDRASVG